MKHPDLILVDGSSYLYRAFHALPPLTNSSGEPTGAMYGVLNMLRKLIKEHQPRYIAIVFDAKGKTFRHDMYSDYKATRPPMPDDLRAQINPLHDIIKAMGLPLLCVNGVEADDVIGTLARHAAQKKLNVLISTGDKDMAQLVDDHVTLINTMNNHVMDSKGVREKFGVSPERMIDYLALMGDTSDNIPGVPKVGPKTAAKWLQEYESLENIVAQAESFKGKIGENLRVSLSQLSLSKQLVTIKTDVDLAFDYPALEPQAENKETLIKFYQHFEFRHWLSELLDQAPQQASHYETILTVHDLNAWVKKLSAAQYFAFDTETTSLDPITAEVVGVSFALEGGKAAYVPIAHDYIGAPEQLSRDTVFSALSPILDNPDKTLIGQNLKYDLNVLKKYAITFRTKFYDTMLESYVLNSASNRHDMDTLSLKYLGKRTIKFEDIAGKGKNQLTFNQIALDVASPYAAEDADITYQLHQTLWPKVEADEKLHKIFDDIDMPTMHVLAEMEYLGVLIDADLLKKQSAQLSKRIIELENQAYQLSGVTFNLASPKQLREILFDKMGLPATSKTPTGAPSTAESALQELAHNYPLPKVILEHRSLSKLKSTYTDSLPKQINPITGRVHTSYNQAVTATGRLSSTAPNLQNIPVRTESGRAIRQAFIAPAGYKIISADYSQIELRLMAHLTQDEGLMKAFAQGLDIHRATASEVFNVSLDEVTSDQRRHAKAINFGLIYGMSAFGLARELDISRKMAQEYVDMYFERYPGIKQYMDDIREIAHEQGYVETIFGRRLYLPEINASNFVRKRAAERQAINAPMQGSAADLIKIAMIKVSQWIHAEKVDIKMIMQVHDELVFEVAEDFVFDAVPKIREFMTTAVSLSIPLEVAVGVGDNWDAAH